MLDARLDLSRSPIKTPARFYQVRYDHERYPGAPAGFGASWAGQTASNRTARVTALPVCDQRDRNELASREHTSSGDR